MCSPIPIVLGQLRRRCPKIRQWLGQFIGWYGPDEQAGFLGAIVGAVIVLMIWGFVQASQERNRTGS